MDIQVGSAAGTRPAGNGAVGSGAGARVGGWTGESAAGTSRTGDVTERIAHRHGAAYPPPVPSAADRAGRVAGTGPRVVLPLRPAAVTPPPARSSSGRGPEGVRRSPSHPAGRRLPQGARAALPVPSAAQPTPRRAWEPVVLRGGAADVPTSAVRVATPGPVRLTRRGRRLLVALAAGVGVLVAAAVGSIGGPGDDLALAGARSVVVQPGDTLWTIAASVATGEDVRAVVDELREANHLQGTTLVPGQVLTLP